jgi:hypothetical protein
MHFLKKYLLYESGKLPNNCYVDDSRQGEIDEIIIAINKLEVPFFNLRIKDNCPQWWDFLRYSVVNNICIERKIYTPYKSKDLYKKNIFKKIITILKLIIELIKFFNSLIFLRFLGIKNIFISSRKPNELSRISNKSLIVGNKNYDPKILFISKIILDKIIGLISYFIICPKKINKDIKKISLSIKKEFESNLNFELLLLKKYKLTISSIYIWRLIIFLIPKLEEIKYVNDDMQKGLVFLANQLDIKTCEIQHAYMGKSHEGYAYPKLKTALNTIPNETHIFFDSSDIIYPSKIIHKESLSKLNKNNEPIKKEFDLLIGSSPRKSIETRRILQILTPYSFRIAVKLHPVESINDFLNHNYTNINNVDLFDSQHSFNEIACKSTLYLPISHNSTSIFDAYKMGCFCIIYNSEGRKLTNMTDKIDSCYCFSESSLGPLIKYLLEI